MERAVLARQPRLKKRFVKAFAKERFLAEDPQIFLEWFDLFATMTEKHGVQRQDVRHVTHATSDISGLTGATHIVRFREDLESEESAGRIVPRMNWNTLKPCQGSFRE
jgi:hypothetical protein